MAVKYYAVRKGIKPGIYKDWNTCKAMVTGFSGAQYKSFTRCAEGFRVLNLNRPDRAVVFSNDGKVLETSMDDIEVRIAGDYLEKNRKFMHLSMVHLTRRHMYTVMADFLSMMALKKYCRVPAKMRTWLP